MTFRSQLHIDGQWRDGSSSKTFPVVNPAVGEELTAFAVADDADCDAAVAAAESALEHWRTTSPRDRSELLRATFEILRDDIERLAEIIVLENGKSFADALGEAKYAIEFFRWYSEEAARVHGDFRRSPSDDKHIIVTHEPVGVALLVTPWNYPAAMATRKIAPALAAGCTVVLKPARETPLAAAFVVDALQRAGVPSGVVNLVTPVPTGPAVSRMLHHPAVRKLSFTGSTEVGRVLLHEAADQVISSSMELGGNAPFVVLPDADVDMAVEGALVAKMRNGGSACTAANRFYIHSSLCESFISRMVSEFSTWTVGPGSDRSNQLGALVSIEERDKVADLVDRAVEEGAEIVCGGKSLDGGAFYEPTVLRGVAHDSEIARTEIFGPVVSIIEYDEVDDAIRMANDTIFGLIAYVYGEKGAALSASLRIEAGMVAVNKGVLSDPAAPFGGMKQSGLGREGSSEGILEFLEEKYIGVDL
ncbi:MULTISPECIES: NAD-dependent succinate-semialdehyde dehydrogenase [Nocardiaceae]|uniref:NAD-dependent succinate-semialdehyde dehydrogenase n=1 Tax=Nocardiaceae TaxID=85025 RepID=UPI000561F3A8|nr:MULTISPECIES: NAD-dependent succinate-semialdehyde dehydrogenase [Rhodococcus]OZE95510.1 NAD-dependent succinate-semialdehyde dehydrogenase [Rhodococcus sp. 15-1189-1-1a]OZF10141.1 NAD-dependent succinate-semialdehyde dehydrogenase [Rhodococcus sp. 14-2686-1-2]OZF55521.1 NAD-dependent succinate-semialdehyde dehydrogenase [Rhodococcus sp. 14-2470-1b]